MSQKQSIRLNTNFPFFNNPQQSPPSSNHDLSHTIFLPLDIFFLLSSFIFSFFGICNLATSLISITAVVPFYIWKTENQDFFACVKVTLLVLTNHIEFFNYPLAASTGTFLLSGIAFLYTKNWKVHTYNLVLCLTTSTLHTVKTVKTGFLEDQIEAFYKILYVRIFQGFALWYFSKGREINADKKINKAQQKIETISKQLVDIGQFKTNFLSCFSHEVRNPLNIIRGSIEILQKSVKDSELYQVLQGARLSSEVLLKLVNNLLDASNLQSNNFEMSYKFDNLMSILTHLVNLNKEELTQKKLTLQIYVERQIPEELHMDAGSLLQLLINLVSNAMKFSEEGQLIQIYLTWHSTNTPHAELLSIETTNPFAKRHGFGSRRETLSGSSSPSLLNSPTKRGSHSANWLRVENKLASESSEVVEVSSAEWAQKKTINTLKLDSPLKKVSIGEINTFCGQVRDRYNVIDTNTYTNTRNFKFAGSARQNKPGILKVEVCDQGCGISKADQGSLYELFTPGDSSVTRKNGGIGLGLWLTKKILEKAGGKIQLYSEEKRGATFVFYMPMAPPEESMISFNSRIEHSLRTKNKLRALVVDDMKMNREVLQTFLEGEGVEVVTAENGLEAVQIYQKNRGNFDFLFIDIQMPQMDGVTASKKIRAIEAKEGRKKVDIYIVSANCGDAEKNECLDPANGIGAKAFLAKPVDSTTMKRIVRINRLMQKL